MATLAGRGKDCGRIRRVRGQPVFCIAERRFRGLEGQHRVVRVARHALLHAGRVGTGDTDHGEQHEQHQRW